MRVSEGLVQWVVAEGALVRHWGTGALYIVPDSSTKNHRGGHPRVQGELMNDMGQLGSIWQVLLGLVITAAGLTFLVHTIGWYAMTGVFLTVIGLIIVNGTKFKTKSGKKKR